MQTQMLNKTFALISLGCDKNRVDGERLLGEIASHGCPITTDLYKAQVLIVNTCAFLTAAREEAILSVLEGSRLKEEGKLEKLVVTGCLPQGYEEEVFPALTEADVFLGTADAKELFPALERAYAGERVSSVGSATRLPAENGKLLPRVLSTPDHYKFLKISEGCSNHCTYCLIPSIRGKYLSYPMEALIEEAKGLGRTEELILVAQDITRYGEDTGENKLVPLLKKLSELDNICHIRLLYCYPEKIGEELIAEIRDNPKILKYLDIPLQHAEDRVLKLMGRRGTRAEYLALFARLRAQIPGIALRTTFISGFPTETEEEHRALLAFLKEAKGMTLISLTATPPYDSTPAQWKRYIDLCGPIDEEIFTPELVREKSLCPHEDYVYFNWPAKEELEEIRGLPFLCIIHFKPQRLCKSDPRRSIV